MRLVLSLRRVGWWALACGVSGSWMVACGDNFSGTCQEALTCPSVGGSGGQDDDDALGGSGAHDAGGNTGQTAGSTSQAGGHAGDAAADNAAGSGMGGGSGEPPLTVACDEGYVDWLKGSFGFPDGVELGTLDSPSFPWRSAAGLEIDGSRLSGTGTAVVTQGTTFSYSGTRLRARLQFSDGEQEVGFAVNTAADGSGGLRVTVGALGELVLSEGQANRGQASFDPLTAGEDYFVEVALNGAQAVATLATGNYAKEGSIVATVATDNLLESAKGARASVRLDSQSGVSPNVDELSVARCGGAAPGYDALLVDNFERADSATIGSPQAPANSSWTSSDAAAVKIVGGTLQVKEGESASIPVTVPLTGLRIRAAVEMVSGSNASLWADVSYNVPSFVHGCCGHSGFWVFGAANGPHYTGIFDSKSVEKKQAALLAPNVTYYVQFDRDDEVGVLTVRSQSFSGPILSVMSNPDLAMVSTGSSFTLGELASSDGTRFDEIRADGFAFD